MSSLWIIIQLDTVYNINFGLLPVSVVSVMDQFCFEGMEETYHGGVVPTVSFSTHKASDAMCYLQVTVFFGAILAATIGFMEEAFGPFPFPDGQE